MHRVDIWPGPEEAESVVHMANTSDGSYMHHGLEASGDILRYMERLTLDEPKSAEDTDSEVLVVDRISFRGHDPIGSGKSNNKGHETNNQSPSPPASKRFSPFRDLSTLSEISSSSWVTTPGSTLTSTSPPSPPTQSLTPLSVEVESIESSWVISPDRKPPLSISTDNTLAYGGNELHAAFSSDILAITSTSNKHPKPRYAPKLQPAEDVFLTKDMAHAKRLKQNYNLGTPRLKGYRSCKAPYCSCRLRIQDFEQSPTAKRFKFIYMSSARVGCSWRHGFSRL